jgi:tetratricopeptide (TPR) repeat protein
MQSDIHDIDQHLISAEELARYLSNTSAEAEKIFIDELLEKDEFLKDAVEGLKQVKNPNLIAGITKEINAAIAVKTGYVVPKPKVLQLSSSFVKPVLAIASAVVLVAGSYLLIQQIGSKSNQATLAVKKEVAPIEKTKSMEESTIYSDAEKLSEVNNKKISSNEDAIQNQHYINDLDSVTNSANPPSIVNAPNMLNPMKNLSAPMVASGGTYQSLAESSLVDEILDKKNSQKESATIKGQVIDRITKKPINGVTILVDGQPIAASNANGFYELKLLAGQHQIGYSQVGYDNTQQDLNAENNASKVVDIELNQNYVAANGVAAKFENKEEQLKDQSKATAPVYIEKANDNSVTKTDVPSLADLSVGLNNYAIQKYDLAISSFNKTLAKDPNNKEALFYVAMSHYNTGSTAKAITYYNKTIANGGKYKEDALWYKAQILLKQKNTSEAKNILESLKNTKYNDGANKLLQGIPSN